mmetsp:Transcript_91304/g.237887  ORF Transcript_91304/g.237887 Transcript_91304/m.237887 type:complete len:538 (-) Transcript_91304:86-1699(-)
MLCGGPRRRRRRSRGLLLILLLEAVKEVLDVPPVVGVLDDIGGHRDGLDAGLVLAAQHAEEAVLAPVRAPAVLDAPVGGAIVLAVADEQHGVVDLLPLGLLGLVVEALGLVDAIGVVHEVLGRLETHDHGAVMVELLHDGLGAGVPVEGPDVAVVVRPVPLALQLVQVTLQLAGASGVVAHARGGHQAHVRGPLAHQEGVAPLAALVVLAAEEGHVDRPGEHAGVVLPDLVPGAQHAHRGGRVAAAAVALVHHGLQPVRAVRGVTPVPRRGQRGRARALQEARARVPAPRGGLQHHVAVELARRRQAPDPCVAVDLAHGLPDPLPHDARLPAELQHVEPGVQPRHLLRHGRVGHRLVLCRPRRRRLRGRQRNWGLRLHLRREVAAELGAVQVMEPAHHGVAAVREVLLLVRHRVPLESEVREGEEGVVANLHLEALVVHHRPGSALALLRPDEVRAAQLDEPRGPVPHHVARGLCVLRVRMRVPAGRPLAGGLAEHEIPLALYLVPQAMHRQVAGRPLGQRGQRGDQDRYVEARHRP